MKNKLLSISLIPVLISACSSPKNLTATISNTSVYQQYKIDSVYTKDTSMAALLNPYKEEVKRQMNVVIGETVTPLERKTPEGTLGNFAVDAMLHMARIAFKAHVDAAIVNHDGLRLDEITAGPLTLGTVYELMPFGNEIVLINVSGVQLKELLDLIASKKGWPVSNINMQIKDGFSNNVTINGKGLDANSTYTLAVTDYTAKGNEGAVMLKNLKAISKGYLLRNALIEYIKEKTSQGQKISASIESRITYVK